MRYRALGRSHQSISALTLQLGPETPRALRAPLIVTALECGINSFDLDASDPALLDDAAPAFCSVDRRLLFVAQRVGVTRDGSGQPVRDFSSRAMLAALADGGRRAGIGLADMALLNDPQDGEVTTAALDALTAARDAGRLRRIGVAGEGEAMDTHVKTDAFDTAVTRFSLQSGWKERHRVRAAQYAHMAVIAFGYLPDALKPPETMTAAVGGLFSRLFSRAKDEAKTERQNYEFLDHVKGWTAEEVCLAHALTEPGLCSVAVAPRSVDHLEKLAEVPDREIPSNLPAQIEMARFAGLSAA